MKFYRISALTHADGHNGYSFATSMKAAEKQAAWIREQAPDNYDADGIEIEVIEVTPTRAGILSALNNYATHCDNG